MLKDEDDIDYKLIGKDNKTFREHLRFLLIDCQTPLGRAIDIFILIMNLFVVFLFIIDTYVTNESVHQLIWNIELFIVCFFIIEFILRLYASRRRLRHMLKIYSIIDIIAILPTIFTFISSITGANIGLRFLHILRVFRIFRFMRFMEDPKFFFGEISMHLLKVARLIFTIFLLFFITAGIFFHVENEVNPRLQNFGDAFYFTVVTLTTVGFGDITPQTTAGQWTVILMIISGILVIPWQASQVMKEWILVKKKDVTCSKCGLRHHDEDAIHCKACGNLIYQEFENTN
jgi:voltage-gated potassium channel